MHGVIYIIRNTVNSKFYLGSTTNFEDRKRKHLQGLRRGDHHNIHLLHAYRKYGEDVFEFKVKYESSDIKSDEQKELDSLDWEMAYNISPHAVGGDVIAAHPDREAILQKMSETKKRLGFKPSNRKRVSIKGIEYDSYHDAHKALQVPIVTIRYRCLSANVKFKDWVLLEAPVEEFYREGDSQGTRLTVEGTNYPSYASAHRATGLSVTAVIHRCKSDNFPEWQLR